MKKLEQRLHNMKLSLKLLVSYVLIVAVATTGMGIVLYHSAHERLQSNLEQMLSQAAQTAYSTLEERCQRINRSLSYLATDTYVQNIINEQNYLSNYQKAYDVNNYLEPAIVSVMEQNPLIDGLAFYTYGEVKGTRNYIYDIEEYLGASFLECGEQAAWRFDGEKITASRVLANSWQPNQSSVLVCMVLPEVLFSNLLPEMELNCAFRLTDAEGNLIFEQRDIAQSERWEKNAKCETVLLSNGWILMLEGDTSVQTQAMSRSVLLPMGLILAGLCLVMLLVAWRFSSGIARRLDRLQKQVDCAVTEEYQNDITSEDSDEIGQITNSVGNIVRQTRQLMRQTYQSELDSRDAQIQALQAQINPHFLYNTLSNLNWRLIAKGDEEGSTLVTELSRFYRLSLNGGEILSTIDKELQLVNAYIRLYCATHESEQPEILSEIDEGLGDCKLPGLILQPLVENAFEHGRPEHGRLRLCIRVREERERVIVSVSDNGAGLQWNGKTRKTAEEFFENYSGYGLRNVHRRLQLLFDEPCSMFFEPSLEGGTSVVLRIPLECGQ